MIKRRGSFRERNKPLISLRNLSDEGTIVLPRPDYKIPDPPPNSWVMIKPGDILVSGSGTIRIVLKKKWQEGEVHSLRMSCGEKSGKMEASLEVEKLEIDSSNFEHLSQILRPTFSNDISPSEFKPEFFTRAVRYNILTFLGFGKVGSEIHAALPQKEDKKAPPEFTLTFFLDTSSNLLFDLRLEEGGVPEGGQNMNWTEIAVKWTRQSGNRYIISQFSYLPDTSRAALDTVTIASEVANAIGLTSTALNT